MHLLHIVQLLVQFDKTCALDYTVYTARRCARSPFLIQLNDCPWLNVLRL